MTRTTRYPVIDKQLDRHVERALKLSEPYGGCGSIRANPDDVLNLEPHTWFRHVDNLMYINKPIRGVYAAVEVAPNGLPTSRYFIKDATGGKYLNIIGAGIIPWKFTEVPTESLRDVTANLAARLMETCTVKPQYYQIEFRESDFDYPE